MPENAQTTLSDVILRNVIARAGLRPNLNRWAARGLACALIVMPSSGAFTAESTLVTGPALPVTVAIDPGHGGTNLGAAGPGRGVYEKNVTLALAGRIRDLLAAGAATSPPITVVLCRETDTLIPIRARARCARQSGARLFLSLHANAVPVGVPRGTQSGFEVFVLGPHEVEDDAVLAELAERDDASAVWAAHEVRGAAEQSIVLGRMVSDHLTRRLGTVARRGIKQSGAALDVLRGSGVAAALVEVGFLDHLEEGAKLASPEGREPIAQALAAAIREYVGAGSPAGPDGVARNGVARNGVPTSGVPIDP